ARWRLRGPPVGRRGGEGRGRRSDGGGRHVPRLGLSVRRARRRGSGRDLLAASGGDRRGDRRSHPARSGPRRAGRDGGRARARHPPRDPALV
ncbi:MAG: hypothetical protein AVDCRST_MAG38-608, partial [uncultured Solirubrobacteraceae bacterium]